MSVTSSLLLPNGKNRPVKRVSAAGAASAMPFLFSGATGLHSVESGVLPLGLLPVCKVAQADMVPFLPDTVFGFKREDFASPGPLFFSRQTAERFRRSQIVCTLPNLIGATAMAFTIASSNRI